jgi:hypothetical protein
VGEFRRGDLLDRAFLIGMVLKGLDGVLEVIGGLLRSGTQICVLVQGYEPRASSWGVTPDACAWSPRR